MMQKAVFQLVILIFISKGAISHAPPMIEVAHNRQERPVRYIRSLPENLDLSQFECCIGVDYHRNHLVGREAIFITDSGIVSGRWLIVDYEEPGDRGILKRRGLAADLACHNKEIEGYWIHKKGKLYLVSNNGVH